MHQLDDVKNTYDLTAEEYANTFYQELDHKPLDRLLLTRFAARARTLGRVADIGCGCGHTTAFLKDCGIRDLIGIDLSGEMISQAKNRNPSIEFEGGNLLDLSLADESLGSVLAFYAIVHFNYTECEIAFSEVHRTLVPGGQFFFSFHVGEEVTELDEFLGVPTKITFYYFDVDKIHELLVNTGFEIEETVIRYPYTDVEYPSKRAYISARKKT